METAYKIGDKIIKEEELEIRTPIRLVLKLDEGIIHHHPNALYTEIRELLIHGLDLGINEYYVNEVDYKKYLEVDSSKPFYGVLDLFKLDGTEIEDLLSVEFAYIGGCFYLGRIGRESAVEYYTETHGVLWFHDDVEDKLLIYYPNAGNPSSPRIEKFMKL